MPQDVAELYAQNMIALAGQARGVIRDLNPKVHENEKNPYSRIQTFLKIMS